MIWPQKMAALIKNMLVARKGHFLVKKERSYVIAVVSQDTNENLAATLHPLDYTVGDNSRANDGDCFARFITANS